jgi:elongation factor G
VRLTGGEYDILFSTEEHFRLAGAAAFRCAMERAGSRLLEPWCEVEVDVPADEVGPTLSALTNRRGRILGLEMHGRGVATVRASVPHRELRTFAPRLMALTAGRGRFVRRGTHYEALPASLAAEAIRSSPFRTG